MLSELQSTGAGNASLDIAGLGRRQSYDFRTYTEDCPEPYTGCVDATNQSND